jgi:hypothetical protein
MNRIWNNVLDSLAILILVVTLIVLGLVCIPVALNRWADRRFL